MKKTKKSKSMGKKATVCADCAVRPIITFSTEKAKGGKKD